MDRTLNELERRIVGVLLEKSLTQPAYYPMTVSALVAAANQKTNREPVMDLDDEAVLDTLDELRERGLVTEIMATEGSRTNRYRHEVGAVFGWQQREKAVMTELLLRGPQTAGELRTRCSRMMPFEGLEAVSMVLDCLAKYDPPVTAPLPRVPGQSAIRHTHLLYPQEEQPETATTPTPGPSAPAPPPQAPDEMADLRTQVDALRRDFEALRLTVRSIEDKLGGEKPDGA